MILVTGGTGLIGAHLLLSLAASGERPRAIHRKSSSFEGVKRVFSYGHSSEEAETLFNAVEWMEADTTDVPALSLAFEGISRVYHCAALVSFSPSDSRKLRKINIEGTANVVNLSIARRVQKLCFVSSIATFDLKIGQKHINEESFWNKEIDHSMYAISKYGAEMEVWRASQEGLPVVIVNPGVIIGPGFWKTGSGVIFKKVWRGLKFYFPKVTGFIGVGDVVKCMRLLMDSEVKDEQFLLVAENLSFKTVLEQAALSLNKPLPFKRLSPWLVYIDWAGESLLSLFGRKKQLTLDTAKGLYRDTYYNSSKFTERFGYEFEKMETVIREAASAFKRDQR